MSVAFEDHGEGCEELFDPEGGERNRARQREDLLPQGRILRIHGSNYTAQSLSFPARNARTCRASSGEISPKTPRFGAGMCAAGSALASKR